jgi:hypothetical protein
MPSARAGGTPATQNKANLGQDALGTRGRDACDTKQSQMAGLCPEILNAKL